MARAIEGEGMNADRKRILKKERITNTNEFMTLCGELQRIRRKETYEQEEREAQAIIERIADDYTLKISTGFKTVKDRSGNVGESLEECIKASSDFSIYSLRNQIRDIKPIIKLIEQEVQAREKIGREMGHIPPRKESRRHCKPETIPQTARNKSPEG